MNYMTRFALRERAVVLCSLVTEEKTNARSQ